jgi:hypothetical protein
MIVADLSSGEEDLALETVQVIAIRFDISWI